MKRKAQVPSGEVEQCRRCKVKETGQRGRLGCSLEGFKFHFIESEASI